MIETIVQTKEDLEACLTIRRAVFIDEQGVAEEEEIDDEDHLQVGHHVLLRSDDGQAIATARFKAYAPKMAKIQRVAVLAAHRQGGVGKRVMELVERYALSEGFETAVLDAQCHAEGFYVKLGYVTTSTEPFYDAGILHVRMQKQLK